MPSLIDECYDLFETNDFYGVLNIKKEGSQNEIKCAYRKLSLKVHPDRVEQKQKAEATKKFQVLGKIYSILSDANKRAVYDETGEIDEENDIPQDRDWYDYWRLLFSKINLKDIKDFEKKYKESEEELQDLKTAYVESEGDMDRIMENVLCSTAEDEDRFRDILETLINNKEIPAFKNFTHEKKSKKEQRKRKAKEEAAEAESMKDEMGLGDTDDALKAMILKNQSTRGKEMDSFFDRLEAKYCGSEKKKSGKATKGEGQKKSASGKSGAKTEASPKKRGKRS